MSSKIALRYLDGKDKITLLNEVLDRACFEDAIEKERAASGKSADDFKILIKPNASMFVRRDDEGTTTDPLLALALVERLHEKGYPNISIVESNNAYDLTFANRNPITVMTAMGLNGGVHKFTPARDSMTAHIAASDGRLLPYQLLDLGAKTANLETGDHPHGKLKIGETWLKADFRISFAKFKTHVYGGYTLLVKNTYGCLPETDKMLHYHKATGCTTPAIAQLKICPVHFGIVDGITGADGWMGVKWDRAIPRRPGFILAGRNIAETERVACRIMGVKEDSSLMTKAALKFLAEPSELDGEIRPLEKWRNVPKFIHAGFPITEKSYNFYKFQQTVTDGLASPPFRRKGAGYFLAWLFGLPMLFYGIHRRHWIIRKSADIKLRAAVRPSAKAPRRVRPNLDRLGASELELLLECLKTESPAPIKIYGHKVNVNGNWHLFPNSTYSKLVRIPEIVEALETQAERGDCAKEVQARIAFLTAKSAAGETMPRKSMPSENRQTP